MFENVWNAGVIRGVCLESDGKDIIAILSRDVKMFGARLIMLKVQSCEFKLWNLFGPQQGEAMELIAWLWKVRQICDSSLGSSFDRVAQHVDVVQTL